MSGLMQRFVLFAVLAALLAVMPLSAKPAPKPQPAKVVLPSWAPKNPSKEFLRAARVLRPVPEEAQPYQPTYPAAYELFGTLTDKQMAEFLTRKQYVEPASGYDEKAKQAAKETFGATETGGNIVYYQHSVTLPVKSLTAPQRKAFNRLLDVWGEELKQQGESDLRVQLYKMGATKDLSNVNIRVSTIAAHAVHLLLDTGHGTTGFWFAQVGAEGPTVKVDMGLGSGGGGGGRR